MNPRMPLRVAMIGCGAAFEFLHRDPLALAAKRGWITLAAAADPQEKRRAVAAAAFPGAALHESAAALFSAHGAGTAGAIDLAIVASPPPAHRADTEAALAAGAHVLCEKPLAGTAADAAALAEAANQTGRILSVGMTRRYYPAVAQLRSELAALPAGTDIRFLFRQGGVYGWQVASDAPFYRSRSGGGVLLDMGVHLADILFALFGPGTVERAMDDATGDGVEANAIADLRLARARGRMHLSWDTNLDSALHVVSGDREWWMPAGSIDVLHSRSGRGPWQKVPMQQTWPSSPVAGAGTAVPRSHNECMTFQLIGMLRAILHGEAPVVPAGDGAEVMRLIESAYRIMEPLPQPWLGAEEQERAAARHWRAQRDSG